MIAKKGLTWVEPVQRKRYDTEEALAVFLYVAVCFVFWIVYILHDWNNVIGRKRKSLVPDHSHLHPHKVKSRCRLPWWTRIPTQVSDDYTFTYPIPGQWGLLNSRRRVYPYFLYLPQRILNINNRDTTFLDQVSKLSGFDRNPFLVFLRKLCYWW